MTLCTDAKSSDWLTNRSNAIGKVVPSRDPDYDDEDAEKDEEDRDEARDPAVIRDPDE
jgi:hypothetical protein